MTEQAPAARTKISDMINPAKITGILTAPVIYSMVIPIAFLDLFMTVYQNVCFPVYGVPKVKRGDYVVMDRAKLSYLNIIEKINCIYCEYGNGVLAYATEVTARTEWFWCPIKHKKTPKGAHKYQDRFLDYGDGENFREKLWDVREKCRACESGCGTVTSVKPVNIQDQPSA